MFSVNLIVTHHHRVLKIQTFARLVHLPSRKIRSYQYQEAAFVRLNNKTIPTSQRLQRPSTFFLCLFKSVSNRERFIETTNFNGLESGLTIDGV